MCITQWIDFAPFQTLPRFPSSSCEWNLCHEIARASLLCMRVFVCECVKFYLRYLLPPHFLREIFASLFYLLTLYKHLCLLLVFSIILRPIICSYETKLNFFLLYYSVFVYIRLEDCCCCLVFLFSLQRAMCTADVIWLRARVSVSVYWWARVPTLMRGGGACVCMWGCLNSSFACFASGKRD